MPLETTTTQATPTAPAAPLDFGKRPNVANHVKALNGTRGRGSYHVRVKHNREWNEIVIRLTDGTCTRSTSHIDLGHTTEDKIGALREMYDTVKHLIEL